MTDQQLRSCAYGEENNSCISCSQKVSEVFSASLVHEKWLVFHKENGMWNKTQENSPWICPEEVTWVYKPSKETKKMPMVPMFLQSEIWRSQAFLEPPYSGVSTITSAWLHNLYFAMVGIKIVATVKRICVCICIYKG